jgi:hypothetical protein
VYTVLVSPDQFTLNAGDWSSITATVELSYQNGTPKAVTPQPTIKFYSSDPRVTVSPAGEVCAGTWDSRYLTCTAASTLPSGYVTITAYNASNNVSGTTLVSVHQRAANIALSANYGTQSCISQNHSVQYVATPFDINGTAINPTTCTAQTATASPGTASTCVVRADDYTWSVADSNVASVSSYGYVVAHNPGVTSVYAKLNGTVSVPLTFVTCPPASIVLQSSAFTNGTPVPPYSTADLNTLTKGSQEYITATLNDTNGNPLITSPLNFITSDPLTGSFATVLSLTDTLTANTSGRFTVVASCEPTTCNAGVANFTSPATGLQVTGLSAGFGYPIYSNVLGVTVQGTTGSTVLVTGTTLTDGVTPVHRLEAYDSEAMTLTQTIELANLPNSLVIAPNGAKAYVGSSTGLVVVDLTSYQSSIQTFPIVNGINTDVITGQVLGVSPDSRYLVVSDVTNSLVFLIDTTGTKSATRYSIPGITSVTFAADDSNFWIGGTSGVYTFNSDTFVPTLTNTSSLVTALAWMPDGQSYFAAGNQLVNYSTCNDQTPQSFTSAVPFNLSTTAINGIPHAVGLAADGSNWFDYSVTTTAQIGNATPEGNVCLSKVTVGTPVTTASGLQCTPTQISFAPTLITGVYPAEFVTGVDPACATAESVIHGYNINTQTAIAPLTATSPIVPLSGGVLNDGRKLYIGTYNSTAKTAALHRFDIAAGAEDIATDVDLVPSFVAVVPK